MLQVYEVIIVNIAVVLLLWFSVFCKRQIFISTHASL